MSFETRTKSFQETLATTKFDVCAELDLIHIEARAPSTEALTHQRNMASATGATRREFHSQLEGGVARAEWRREPGACASTAQPPTFDRTTSWPVFRRQFRTVVGHSHCTHQEKSTYLITALKGRAADVLLGIPKNATYEEILQALEDRFGDQHFAAI
jgi:hypothetical protein